MKVNKLIKKIIQEEIKNFITFEQFTIVCQNIFNEIKITADEYLSQFTNGITLTLNNDYEGDSFDENEHWVACYEGGSVFQGEISIVLNYKTLYNLYCQDATDDYETDVKVTIFHELGHGIVEYVNDILTETDEYDIIYDENQKTWDWVFENEEDAVEAFGEMMADCAYYSELDDIVEQISDIYN